MNRKECIKLLLLGASTIPLGGSTSQPVDKNDFFSVKSNWQNQQDMLWVGPSFWGNRLQDWEILNGQVCCNVSRKNRTLHFLTHQLSLEGSFKTQVEFKLENPTNSDSDYIGLRLGANGKFDDYRSAAVFGKGLDVGVTTSGKLFIGDKHTGKKIKNEDLNARLQLKVVFTKNKLTIEVSKISSGRKLGIQSASVKVENLVGNIALVSHFASNEKEEYTKINPDQKKSAFFSDWELSGDKVISKPDNAYGPICFTQYTLDKKILKLTAQLTPVERVKGHKVRLQIKKNNAWETLDECMVDPMARTAHFRVKDWDFDQDIPYRINLHFPLYDGAEQFLYSGTIAKDPTDKDQLKVAVFSCNTDYGFPNNDVVNNIQLHNADMAIFLGDQIYEGNGGFGIVMRPTEMAILDYLHKWYMFGWSYRDIFRDIPCAIIPDDHDMYHGNLWGADGKKAPTAEKGYRGSAVQRMGGYLMPPEWVNAVQRSQTSHLPDPVDPTPVKQGIGVYYTDWNYGGISFAILEDRKFKLGPTQVLPKETREEFLKNNPNADPAEYYDVDADLLRDRQLAFLNNWITDWSNGAKMKAFLSQTPFNSMHTHPKNRSVIPPNYRIPEPGEYIDGDDLTFDMDSGGWPRKGRDQALKIMRKAFALHIAGDQHLANVVQYGIDDYQDSGYVFAGPALNNIWPRRWWPPMEADHEPLLGRPHYIDNFVDKFKNKMTVLAVANPVKTHHKPAIAYDRATGYGIVTFNKNKRIMRIECWPRYVNPITNPEGQYDGWPIIINQQQNYGRKALAFLPIINIEGLRDPVIEVYNEQEENLEYALRISGTLFKPMAFDREATYRLKVGDPDRNKWKVFENVQSKEGLKQIYCEFESP